MDMMPQWAFITLLCLTIIPSLYAFSCCVWHFPQNWWKDPLYENGERIGTVYWYMMSGFAGIVVLIAIIASLFTRFDTGGGLAVAWSIPIWQTFITLILIFASAVTNNSGKRQNFNWIFALALAIYKWLCRFVIRIKTV